MTDLFRLTKALLEVPMKTTPVIRARAEVPPTTLDEMLGCLRYRGEAKTLAEMDAAIVTLARACEAGEESSSRERRL